MPRGQKRRRVENPFSSCASTAPKRPRRRFTVQLYVPSPAWASRQFSSHPIRRILSRQRRHSLGSSAVRRQIWKVCFEAVYPHIVQLFYQNLVVNEGGDSDSFSTVIDGVAVTVSPGDIAAALQCTRVVYGFAPYPAGVTLTHIVNDKCGGRFGSRLSHTHCAFLPTRLWFVDSVLKANVCVSGHHEERSGKCLDALYTFQKGYEVLIPELIWGEMVKFRQASKVLKTGSSLTVLYPFLRWSLTSSTMTSPVGSLVSIACWCRPDSQPHLLLL